MFCLGAADPKTNATAKAEARAEVAEAQEAQEKGLLVDALAKLGHLRWDGQRGANGVNSKTMLNILNSWTFPSLKLLFIYIYI